jgi:8-oxo-dGTP pyrophosphatase MutT (NUDIX family)
MDVISSEIERKYSVFTVRRLVVRVPRSGKALEYHIIDRPDSVQVVALTRDGKLLMVEQDRHGTQQSSLEFVAGLMDAGEEPAKTAGRELEEETGYRARALHELGWYYTDPAILSNKVTVFFAEDCAPTGNKNEDEGEEVKLRLIDVRDVEELISSSAITHGLSISAWHLYQSRVQRSRSRP